MFLSPFFLILAGVGASVPILLHLMQNRRKVQLPFPTLRFLKQAEKHSSRKIRLENFLLWLLRTLIMLLLGMAFAMPMIRRTGLAFLGDSPRDVAIVLDASYSMNYQTGRGTVWEKSLETARAIIEGLSDKDRFCLFLAREQSEALIVEPIGNKQEGLGRLKGLAPGQGSSRLAPALAAAEKALRKAEGQREREIHIITDNQALPWRSLAGEAGAGAGADWHGGEPDPRLAVFVSALGVPAPVNAGVASIELQPAVVRAGADVNVVAHLLRSGGAAETAATLYVDGEQAGRRASAAGDPAAAAPVFNLPPLAAGVHVARIETPSDNLPLDDAFHFLIRVQEPRPTLLVGSTDDTLFVRTALRTGLGRPTAVASLTPEQLGTSPLGAYAGIVLCNALPLSGQAIAALEAYVKAGGLLVIFPGLAASADSYQSWTCLPGFPTAIQELPLAQHNRTLTWDRPQHFLVRPLREGIAVPALAVRRRLVWEKLHEATERLISMGADQPFLLERPFGEGRVLMFAVAADRTWSDFPLSPFYLPLVLQCADYGAGLGASTPFDWATESLSLSERFPDLKGSPSLTGPDGAAVSVRSAMVGGRTVLVAENLAQAGIYTLGTPEQPTGQPALAIDFAREESDLTPIPPEEIPKRLGVDRVQVATDLSMLRRLLEEYRVGRTYGEHLLWAALVLIIVEFIYANLLLRAKPTASLSAGVDLAGHVQSPARVAELTEA